MFEDIVPTTTKKSYRKLVLKNRLYTEKCIVCLDQAEIFSGHVMDGDVPIIAGWCKQHEKHSYSNFMGRLGCYGGWHSDYGKQEDLEVD